MEEAVGGSAEASTWRVQRRNQAASEGTHTALGTLSSLLVTKVKPSHQKQNAELKARASSALQLFKFHPYYHVNFTEVHEYMKRVD